LAKFQVLRFRFQEKNHRASGIARDKERGCVRSTSRSNDKRPEPKHRAWRFGFRSVGKTLAARLRLPAFLIIFSPCSLRLFGKTDFPSPFIPDF
jgi:hypothetical protein